MLPDIVGYCLEEGMSILEKRGIGTHNVIVDEYTSPKNYIMGTDKRIIRADEKDGKIVLIIANF